MLLETLLFKNKEYRQYQKNESDQVVESEVFCLKNQNDKEREYYQRDHFLNYL